MTALEGGTKKTHGHQFDSMAVKGQGSGGLVDGFVYPKHQGNAGPVNVCIHQSDLGPLKGQSHCQVRGNSGFANSTLSAGNG